MPLRNPFQATDLLACLFSSYDENRVVNLIVFSQYDRQLRAQYLCSFVCLSLLESVIAISISCLHLSLGFCVFIHEFVQFSVKCHVIICNNNKD